MKAISMFIAIFLALNASFGFDMEFWSSLQKFPVPKYRYGNAEVGVKARQIYYEGELFNGRPTEIFAYYCTPGILNGDPSLDKNLPAIVCLHGGGGRAFPEWVESWAKKGYAAIAMDWSGNGSELFYKNPTSEQRKKLTPAALQKRAHMKNGGPNNIPSSVSLSDGKAEKDAWAYQAVGAVARAHSLVRSFKEVDANRTAITGISWGGYLTCLTVGVDQRFKAAVPVYGCGYIYMYEKWFPYLGKNDKTEARWIELFDPSNSLKITKVPMLFVNSPKDPFYPISIWGKSVKTARAQACLISGLGHSHKAGWSPPEIEAFISSKLNGTKAAANLGELKIANDRVSCRFDAGTAPCKKALLFYTKGGKAGDWSKYEWGSVPAEIKGANIGAKIPQGAKAAYLSIEDGAGLRATSNPCILSKWRE